MKKLFILLTAVVTLLMITGCAVTTCDLCGETGLCNKGDFLGETVHVCQDCTKELKEVQDGLEDLADLFG